MGDLLVYLQKRYEKNANDSILLEIGAEIHLTRGNYTQAAEGYVRLSSVQPRNVRSFYYAAAALNKCNQLERARSVLNEGEIARSRYSGGRWNQNGLGLVALASICLQGELYDAAILLLETVLSNLRYSGHSAEEVSYHMLAEAYIGAKRYTEAAEAYRQVANITRYDHVKKVAREGIHKARSEGNLPDQSIGEETQIAQ